MGSWSAFFLGYVLGGVTFLPLILAAILLHAYLTFPYREDVDSPPGPTPDDIVQPGDDLEPLKETQKLLQDPPKAKPTHHEPDTAAGYFAVCREYAPMGINAKPIERSTPVGSTTVAAPSPSVYQTMYRTIFDRKQNTGPLDDLNSKNISQRPKKAGNVFFVVLRHGHLMLFDDDDQIEVRHVISLAHHDISLFAGGEEIPEGELFIKRNALCLSRRRDEPEIAPDSQLSKPFFLFSENCSAKEDFYFALLRNQEQTIAAERKAPMPLQFETKNIITLVQKLHSSEEHLQTRWLNAMIGRIFLGVYKTTDVENFIREKLTKKISRVKRPTFLSNITIKKIETGESAPYFTNPRLRDLTVEGECSMEADVKYTGKCRIEVGATARLELGSRFKAREVNLVLAVVLKKVEGHLLFKIKPPPSNRIWLSFQQMPKMEMTIEPIVSSRQITYTVILRQIENRIKEVIAETLVLPFWDDVPFFRTEHKQWRGGIWEGDDAVDSSKGFEAVVAQTGNVDDVEEMEDQNELPPMEKSYSVPIIESTPPTGLFGRKLTGKGNGSLKATGSSTSVDKNGTASAPGLPRSGAFSNASTPTVGTDSAHADVFGPSSSPPDHSPATDAIATLSAKSQPNSPASTPLESPLRPPAVVSTATSLSSASSTKDGTDSDKDNESTPRSMTRRYTTSSSESIGHENAQSSPSFPPKSSSVKSQGGSMSRGFFLRRDNSGNSLSAPTEDSGHADNGKRSSLAAVTNAAASAKRWGWNALQRAQEAKNGHHTEPDLTLDLSKPMGGGHPLPPPGTPLPMPEKSTARAIPMPKRKPVPPPPLPDRPRHEASPEHKIQRRPVPPPPLPRRRQAPGNESADDEDNMLVVAAPLDSEPNTPLIDENEQYLHPYVEDLEEEGGAPVSQAPVASAGPTHGPRDEVNEPPQAEGGPSDERTALHTPGVEEKQQDVPAVEGEDDDDEFDAWMDNMDDPEPETSGQPVQSVFTASEGMAQ